MPLKIIRNDITKVEADAIVNTANPYPVVGAGTDFAIHEAAGPELLLSRRQIGEIAPGHAAATPAFGLPARYVLHAVGPRWIDGTQNEAALLRETYDAALALADSLGCRSVAFPLLSAGSCGFPRDLALSVAIGAITDFLMEHELLVCLTLFDAEAFDLAGSLFSDLKSYIDDNYAALQTKKERAPQRMQRRWMRNDTAAERYSEDADLSVGSVLPPMAAMASATADGALADLLRNSESTFSEYLMDLLREREGKDSEVYKRAEISKQLFSKILSNRDYQPTKHTAVQLAIGLQLDLNQTQKLLGKAGYALTRSSKTDLVVQYYIERKIYSVTFINEALYDCGLPLLKTGLKS